MNNYFENVENWFSDKILFKVNDTASFIIPPLVFFDDKSISLKTKITFKKEGIPDAKNIILEALEIKEESIPDSKFEIPEYRRIVSLQEYSKELMEKFKIIDADLQKSNDKILNQENSATKQNPSPKLRENKLPQKNSLTNPKE
jgi:hypothetical protein